MLLKSGAQLSIQIWKKILILQKKALRLLTYNDTFPNTPGPLCPCNPIFCKLETMKVMDIYRYQVSKFVFKSINSLAPRNFHGWFQLTHERYGYRTRSILVMTIVPS